MEPLLKALHQANIANANYSQADPAQAGWLKDLQQSVATPTSTPWTGYFSLGAGASAPIQVLIDIKTDGNKTWPYVVKQLQPLRDLGWLTRYDKGTLIPGPVTIIGTGATPISQVAPLEERDYFFDCPLGALEGAPAYVAPDGTSYPYNSTLCGIASVDFEKLSGGWKGLTDSPPDAVKKSLIDAVDQSHRLGIKTRYWDTPEWPRYAMDNVNKFLLSIGSDWINADDLEYVASKF